MVTTKILNALTIRGHHSSRQNGQLSQMPDINNAHPMVVVDQQ